MKKIVLCITIIMIFSISFLCFLTGKRNKASASIDTDSIIEIDTSSNWDSISSSDGASSLDSVSSNTIKIVSRSISEVTSSEEYKKASLDEKVDLIEPVLKELSENGYISDYEYSLDSPHPSVALHYSNGIGTVFIILEEE
ncbi:MAG: hypothetical protein E7494_13660 [Ruminococcus albus]|nr:hypothetical protein [Ruminococcus albus]